MGHEISLPKFRTVSPYDASISLRMQNNYMPLSFHHVHGENIKLSKSRKIACRHEGFCKGIAFSDRPVQIGEPVFVKFVKISTNWSGALRIGFTMNDPNTMKSKLPKYACPDLTSISGNWAKAIAERLARQDAVLYFFVDQNGDVHYGIDNEEHGIFFGGVDTSERLWVVLDVYGNTTEVEFIEPRNLESSNTNCLNLLPDRPLQFSSGLFFHNCHGKHAVLKANRLVASRQRGASNLAYVFTDRPVDLNENLLLKIVSIDPQANSTFYYGITNCNPSSLLPDQLPEQTDDLLDRSEYWVVRGDTNSYQVADVINICINNAGEVSILKNNVKTAKFHVDQTQHLWVFFNLCGVISELQILNLPDSHEVITQRLENLTVNLPGNNNLHNAIPGSSDLSNSHESDIAQRLENLTVNLPGNNNLCNAIPGSSGDDGNLDRSCVVCFEDMADCALYRCGHVCMCYKCAKQIWCPGSNVQCPICREPIRDVIKIYT